MHERKERRDSLLNRQIILQKAQSLFTEYGVDSVSMHQIAKSAGIGQGTLYRRYAHKGELCIDLLQENFRRLMEDIDNDLYAYREHKPRHRLEKVIQSWLGFVELHAEWLNAIKAPGCEENKVIMYHSFFYKSLHDIIRGLLEEAALQSGDPSCEITYIADCILAAIAPPLYMFQRQDRGYSQDEILRNLNGVFIDPIFP